jgi:hypothetical protein
MSEIFKKSQKRKRELIIKPMPEILAVMRNWTGAYDLKTGNIELGSTEKGTPVTLWHEQMHKLFFENEGLEACVMWDKIARTLERQLFPEGSEEKPYVWTQPPKKAKYEPPKHKTLEEKGLSKEKSKEFGLGLTTYKSGEVKDYQKEAWRITNQIITELITPLKIHQDISVIQGFPTIGYWKGNKEPSAQFILKGELTEEVKQKILSFKEKYHQESIMVFHYGQKGWMGIQIHGLSEKDLSKLNLEALTYDFERERILVFGEKLDISTIRTKVRELGGNLTSFNVGVEFL